MGSRKKQSFIAGSLTSSAGIFISKALGLLYVVPFNALAGGESNMFFYSSAYTYYDLLLQICTAGLPFAIAAMVAKYASREDYKTVILVKKLSMSILLLSGFLAAVLFMLVASPLSKYILSVDATAKDISTLINVFRILALAIIIVPFLSAYRGYYQGLREFKAYAFSQVLEQLVRVISLLALGYFTVKVLNMDNIYAIYMAVLSTSLAALAALVYYINFDRHNFGVIARAARRQETKCKDSKDIFVELLAYGLPYVIVAILGNSMNIVNNNFFMSAMASIDQDYETAKTILGIIQVNANKLTSIPQVLAIGFSAGIVPHLTVALEHKDYNTLKSNVLSALDTVLYISLPLCFCLFALSEPIYFVMYGKNNLELGKDVLMYSSMLALTGTISPICSSMMMTLKFRRKSILYLLIGFIVKVVSFFPMIKAFGYSGAITSSVLTSLVIIYLNLQHISNRYKVNYTMTVVRLLKMCVALIAMNGSFAILRLLGLEVVGDSRITGLFILGIYGVIGCLVYYYASSMLNLPQKILGITLKDIIIKLFRGNNG